MNTEETIQLSKVRALTASGMARSIRISAKLSLPEVAEAVGVSAAAVYRWEKDERRPTGEAAIRYLVFLTKLVEDGS